MDELMAAELRAIRAEIAAHDRRYSELQNAAALALHVALAAADKRLDQMNEFRGALADQQVRFLTRDEYNAEHTALEAAVARVELSGSGYPSKADTLMQFQRSDERTKVLETKLANYDGRLWMLGVAFTVGNVLLNWLLHKGGF